MSKKVKILFHDVEYWYEEDSNRKLSDIDYKYIKQMIIDGYSSGQLVSYDDITGDELYGWWQIKGYETQ